MLKLPASASMKAKPNGGKLLSAAVGGLSRPPISTSKFRAGGPPMTSGKGAPGGGLGFSGKTSPGGIVPPRSFGGPPVKTPPPGGFDPNRARGPKRPPGTE